MAASRRERARWNLTAKENAGEGAIERQSACRLGSGGKARRALPQTAAASREARPLAFSYLTDGRRTHGAVVDRPFSPSPGRGCFHDRHHPPPLPASLNASRRLVLQLQGVTGCVRVGGGRGRSHAVPERTSVSRRHSRS